MQHSFFTFRIQSIFATQKQQWDQQMTAEHPHTVIMGATESRVSPPARGRAIASRRHRDLPVGDMGSRIDQCLPAILLQHTPSIYHYWDMQSPFTLLEKKSLYLNGIQGRHTRTVKHLGLRDWGVCSSPFWNSFTETEKGWENRTASTAQMLGVLK